MLPKEMLLRMLVVWDGGQKPLTSMVLVPSHIDVRDPVFEAGFAKQEQSFF